MSTICAFSERVILLCKCDTDISVTKVKNQQSERLLNVDGESSIFRIKLCVFTVRM